MVIASIDIGSNTVLLLIAEVDLITGNIIKLKDKIRLPRISQGIIRDGKISSESVNRLFTVLHEYFEIIRSYKCKKVLLFGTNAFRIASNTPDIKTEIKKEFGVELKVLTGEEEAEFAFTGTEDYASKNKSKLVIDIGGGSTEIIFGKEQISYGQSFKAGVVSASEKFLKGNRPSQKELNEINDYLEKIFNVLPNKIYDPDISIALAGTPVTLVYIRDGLKYYDETKIEGSNLTIKDVKTIYNQLSKLTPKEILKSYSKIVKGREDLILTGACFLLFLIKLLKIDNVIVSNKGLRYGAIRKYLKNAT